MSDVRADELFAAALELPSEERAAFVTREAGANDALRDEVLSLLAHDERAGDFLAENALQTHIARDGEAPERIGGFEILGVLGEGGMGVVYLARQERPRRLVALKVIRAGLASPTSKLRFAHEAELLARLQHPGIAQVLEVGQANGLPYFAMEHVRGRPIDEHASLRELDLRARLALVADVCDAVQHAHERGVVHRDLKPSNVLVDDSNGDARVKVLDFGIARAIDVDVQTMTALTEVGQVVGTLAYMSPEQASGEPGEIDARADVYALGAIAYELACGRTPLDVRGTSLPEALRRVREVDPTSIADIARGIPRDVTTILGHALEKDRARRYASAAQLADDLRRWLGDRPILARPPTTIERATKFVRRHRALVAATTAVFLALLAGTITTATQLSRAQIERDRARDALKIAEERRVEAELARAAEKTARESAESSARRAQAVLDFQAQVLRSASPGSAGRDVRVVDVLARSAEAARATLGSEPEVEGVVRWSVGQTYVDLGLYDDAVAELREALALHVEALGGDALETQRVRLTLGGALLDSSRGDEAAPLIEAAAAAIERSLGSEHPESLTARGRIAHLRKDQGRLDEALELQRGIVAARQRVLGPEHVDTIYAQHMLAQSLQNAGKIDEAETLERECVDRMRAKLGPDALMTLDQESGFAYLLRLRGKRDEAEALYRHVLEIRKRVQGERHPSTLTSMNNLASLLQDQKKLDECEALFRATLATRLEALGETHRDTLVSMNNLGMLLGNTARLDEAERLHARALEIKRRILPPDDPSTLTSLGNLALVEYMKKDAEGALATYREALDARRRVQGREHWLTAFTQENVGACLFTLKRYAEAETELLEAFDTMRRALGESSPRSKAIAGRLTDLYVALGRTEDAARYRSIAGRE